MTAPVIDFCDCYTGTARQRVADMQWGVVEALGLDLSQGLYPVVVWPAAGERSSSDRTGSAMTPPLLMPDTAVR